MEKEQLQQLVGKKYRSKDGSVKSDVVVTHIGPGYYLYRNTTFVWVNTEANIKANDEGNSDFDTGDLGYLPKDFFNNFEEVKGGLTIEEIGKLAEAEARDTLANGDPEAEVEHILHQVGGNKVAAAIYLRAYYKLYTDLLLDRLNT